MTWLNASMLFGLVLVGIPIIIHLSMRQRPKHYVFPALRFVQQRSETNKRQLRFRHWILLALRCLAALLLKLLSSPPPRIENPNLVNRDHVDAGVFSLNHAATSTFSRAAISAK